MGKLTLEKENTLRKAGKKIPIGKCPRCKSNIIYSSNGADKKNISVINADDHYKGRTYLCAKCKTMVAVIEKPCDSIPVLGVANA